MESRPESNWIESAYTAADGLMRVSVGEDGFTALIGSAGQAESVILSISWDLQARIVARETMLPIWVRGLQPYPVIFQATSEIGEELRQALFSAKLDDYAVWVNRGYLAATGQTREQLALAVRRWAETGCDAYQLNDALAHTAQRQSRAIDSLATLVLHIRSRNTAAVWSGPPLRAEDDQAALNLLMAEPRVRIICGDTTAQIAARLLGKPLRVEQVADNRSQVPPLAYLEGVNLVTEGVITLQYALKWLQGAHTARDLPRHADAATRLANALLLADQIHFIVGRAVSAVQSVEAGSPARLSLIEALAKRLRDMGRLVDIQYF